MKKCNIPYDAIVNKDLIEKAIYNVARTTKHKDKIIRFELFHNSNVEYIYNILKYKKYKHGKYNIFLIKDPKYRVVMSENILDKIINHLVSDCFLKPALYPKLIEENVATRVGKGTKAAIDYTKKYMINMKNQYDNFYILKCDISKYFYNINHDVLKDNLLKIFTDKDVVNILLEIIDSTNCEYINRQIETVITNEIEYLKSIKKYNRIDELKRIPFYKNNNGIGIGAVSNQIFACFYLSIIDHYIKECINIKEYIRYMDDFIIFSSDKEILKKIKVEIENKLAPLGLVLNRKTQIYTSKSGIDFVGYVFSITNNNKLKIRLRSKTVKNMKKKFRKLKEKDPEKYERVKASYKGFILPLTDKSLYNKYIKFK